MTDGHGPCVTMRLPSNPASVGAARSLLTRDLRSANLAPPTIDDARLVLSELVTNGIEHGAPDPDGNIEVCWCVRDHRLRLSVWDGGATEILKPLPLNDHSLRGRGLAIVDSVCDHLHVHRDDGTRITADLSLP